MNKLCTDRYTHTQTNTKILIAIFAIRSNRVQRVAIVSGQVKVGQSQSQYLLVICTLAGTDLDAGHCSRSSLCLVLVDRELNELCCIPLGKNAPHINKRGLLGEGDEI